MTLSPRAEARAGLSPQWPGNETGSCFSFGIPPFPAGFGPVNRSHSGTVTGFRFEMSLVLAAHDDDWARRVVHAVLSDRAQHCLGQPAVAAAAHHEQVRSFGRPGQHRPGTPLRYIPPTRNCG